jgi:hypothetical protein
MVPDRKAPEVLGEQQLGNSTELFWEKEAAIKQCKLDEYEAAAKECKRKAPPPSLLFENFVQGGHYVFKDVTPFFEVAGATEPSPGGKVLFIRPRRWGKSVLGTAWLEYLRGNARAFEGMWAGTRMRSKKLIGVHLDMTRGVGSMADCVFALQGAVNSGLALAEEAALEELSGKQVDPSAVEKQRAALKMRLRAATDFSKVKATVGELTLADCMLLAGWLFNELEVISRGAGRKVALFVDEYDKPCVSAINNPARFAEFTRFVEQFYSLVKGSACIAFLFVTGSSRLAINAVLRGGNDIIDLSYEARAKTALGYTWTDIKELYSEQLELLQHAHGLSEDELNAKMEFWYGNYRWGIGKEGEVFNPYSVNMLFSTGLFGPHWANSGSSSPLFNCKLFSEDMFHALLDKDAKVHLSWDNLKGYNAYGQLSGALSSEGQQSILVSSGILSLCMTPGFSARQQLALRIPNKDMHEAARRIFEKVFEPFLPVAVQECVKHFSVHGDPVQLIVALDACGAVEKLALELAGGPNIVESHIHRAITSLLMAARLSRSDFASASELGIAKKTGKSGKKTKWIDLGFVLRGEDVAYAIELECCAVPRPKENEKSEVVREKVSAGVKQLREDYGDFSTNATIKSKLFS